MQDEARIANWSDEVLPSSDPYMLWYQRHTRLLVGNPSHLSESGYHGVGPSLEALVMVAAGRSYHLAEDAIFRRNGQHALQRSETYYRLHFGHYGVHSAVAAPDTSVPPMSVPSTSAPATSSHWTSVTPPHVTPYISPDSLHVHPTQHTGIPYVVDPDWTPPRYMHDFSLTSPTFRMRPILRPPPECEGEAEVVVVADVAAEVGVRAEAEVEVEVQLQIVIQLHQMGEFHSSK
ncbi:hypothetical protein CsSME_00014692 [Camellia sinensis var. sinensis]